MLPLIDVFQGIHEKYVKDVVDSKSRLIELPTKLKYSRTFTIHMRIGKCVEEKVLCDLGAKINLIPTSMFLK